MKLTKEQREFWEYVLSGESERPCLGYKKDENMYCYGGCPYSIDGDCQIQEKFGFYWLDREKMRAKAKEILNIKENEMTTEKKLTKRLQEFIDGKSSCSGSKELAKKLLESLEGEKKPEPIRLEVDCGDDLCISRGVTIFWYFDVESGEMTQECDLEDFQKWLDDGRPFDDSEIEWEGMEDEGTYCLKKDDDIVYLYRKDLETCIFNITQRTPFKNCEDPNVLKDSNGVPW